MFKIEIAKIKIQIDNKYDVLPEISKDYFTDGDVDFSVSVSNEEIEREKTGLLGDFPPGELESVAVYRKIAERLSDYSAFVFHGATVVLDGEAYVFTAKSGTGKTTHINLWRKKFGDKVKILNGDKPVIRVIDGVPYAAGTPWRGKEGYGEPGLYRLRGVAILERAKENSAQAITPGDALVTLVSQAYIPKTNALSAKKTLIALSSVIEFVPAIRLRCNMEEDAAEVAYSALNNVQCKA